MNLRELVINYLQSCRQRGCAQLPVDDEARGILREWMLAARRAKNGGAPVAAIPTPAAAAASATPAPAAATPAPAAEETGEEDDTAKWFQSLRKELNTDTSRRQTGPAEEEIPFFRPGGNSPEEVWHNFRQLLPAWKPLRELGSLREKVVFGTGDPQADIMFVGDAPNYHDEKAGAPFSGEAGTKLDGMLKAMGLTREQVYLTHLVKFRPALPRQIYNNRPPNEHEIRFSASVLELEARLVNPRVIVALGVIAARGLLQRGDLPLAAYQGQPGAFCGIPVVVTHHPSYLLRTSDLKERRKLWEEMLRVMEMAGLPISDRQRSYFLK